MGHGLSTRCKQCGREDTYMLGVGMAYYCLDNVLNCLPPRNREKVRKILAKCEMGRTEYEHRLYTCPACFTLHDKFFVRIEYDAGKVFETSFRCGRCRRQLRPANGNDSGKIYLGPFLCKSCGQRALEETIGLNWD